VTPLEEIDPRLEAHLRRTLHEVAHTVPGVGADARSMPAARDHGARRLRWLALIAAAAVALAAAGVTLRGADSGRPDRVITGQAIGQSRVDKLPPDGVVQSGTADGVKWWLVNSFHTDACGQPMPGLELVREDLNPVGQVWQTTGVLYGEPSSPGCFVEPAIAEPDYMWSSVEQVGADRLVIMGVHPSIVTLVVSVGGGEAFRVSTVVDPDRPDGPRYAAFPAPATAGLITVEGVDSDGSLVAEWGNSDLYNPPSL
jgi:hypothetical protein